MNNISIPTYQCHKKVQAAKIKAWSQEIMDGLIAIVEIDGDPSITLDHEFVRRHRPNIGGYIVWLEDGRMTYSPDYAFEDGYILYNGEIADPVVLVDPVELDREDKKIVNDVSDYVTDFIVKRFPNGVPDDFRVMMTECVLDAFHDGMRQNELQVKEESRIIMP